MSVIALNSKPKSIDFSDNPICFVLTAANVYQTAGTAAIGYLEKTGTTVDGDTIVISFLDFEFTFTFKTTPDDSGYQLYAGHTVNDTVDELLYNYYIAKYFSVSVHGLTGIKFTAREKGADYTPAFDTSGCSVYSVGTGAVAGVDPVVNPNFKVFIQLMAASKNSSSYEEICTAFLDPDDSGKVYFYPGPILEDAFDDVSLPDFGITSIGTWLASVLDYYINYAEYFGDPPVVRKLHDHKSIMLINGKLHNDAWPTHDFLADLATSKMFLSNRLPSIDTWSGAHDFLFFMNYTEDDYDFTACFDITYTDGTTSVKAKQIPYVNSVFMNIYAIPVGVEILGLDAINPAKTVHSYTVYLEHSGTLISEARTFYLVNRPHKAIQLLFQNNYGCIDSILCTNAKFDFKHEAEFVKKLLSHDYDINTGNDRSVIKEQSLTISTNTGFISQAAAYQLSELFENNNAWLVGNTDYVKIELLGSSPTLIEEKSDLSNFEIKFRISVSGTTSLSELI